MSKSLTTRNMNENAAPISMDNNMDRKIRKPLVEKERREKINQALDEMKKILLESKFKFNHGSTLMKADVATEAAKYMREQKTRIEDLQKENVELKQFLAATTAAASSSMPTTPRLPSQRTPLQSTLLSTASFNPLLFSPPNLLMNQFLLFQQLQNVTKMAATTSTSLPSAAATVPSKPSASSPPSSNATKSESEFDDGSSEDEDDAVNVDVENVDEEQHDETFSPLTTPKTTQINSRKRRHNPSSTAEFRDTVAAAGTEEDDDSGIFDGPSPPKKKQSFGVNDLLK